MHVKFLATMVFLSANTAFAHDVETQTTSLNPIERSLGGLVKDGYVHMTFAPNGSVFLINNRGFTIMCNLSGNFETEILSTCYELGE